MGVSKYPQSGGPEPAASQLSGSNIAHAEAVTAGASELTGVSTHGPAHALYLGASGDVTITTDGESLAFAGLAAGVWHPMPPFTHVTAAGDATGIVAGF